MSATRSASFTSASGFFFAAMIAGSAAKRTPSLYLCVGARLRRVDARRRDDAEVDRDDGRELHPEREHAAVDLAADERARRPPRLIGRGERRHRPAEQLGEDLADLVRVAVDRLLAHEHEVGLLLLDERLERARDEVAVELVVGRVDADGAVGARRERARAASSRSPSGRTSRRRPRRARAFGVCAVLGEAERRFDGVLVERVRLPLETGRLDLVADAGIFTLLALSGSATRLSGTRIFTARLLAASSGEVRRLG